jgi:pyridoxal phosphate-dependent aminotransferase EpsN
MGDAEEVLMLEAFASNWIAPLGPQVDAFEAEFAEVVEARHAVALSSGTAALHLGLQLAGVTPGSDVLVSTLTFAASVFPLAYLGANPVFVDCDRKTWNIDPALVAQELEDRARQGRLPSAVVVVHLYGQCADLDPLIEACNRFDVPMLEDAAEALGARYRGRPPGTFGRVGIFSFNGNKIITTGGGGMLVSGDADLAAHARKLSTQAREPRPYYEHEEIGYNYRLSNLLAAVGRGQLRILEDRVAARRRNFDYYRSRLSDLSGIQWMPEAAYGHHTRWLSTLTIDAEAFGQTPEEIRTSLETQNIEARPVWKPMHQQPVFAGAEVAGGAIADDLFARGLCLPSSSSLTEAALDRVVQGIRACHST